jgi:amino acid adenylation domain-containing protein
MSDPPAPTHHLSAQRLRLMEKLLREQGMALASDVLGIPPRSQSDPPSLSFSQERLWFLDQLEPGSPTYNRPCHFHLVGPLQMAVLQASLAEIIRRHEVLRTAYPAVDGHAAGILRPVAPLSLPLTDIRDLPPCDRMERVAQMIREDAWLPLDLAQGPQFRARLVRLGMEEHILLLTVHHIAFDGWSAGVLARELRVLYGAFSQGKPSPLPELPLQYADFAAWQRDRLTAQRLDHHLSYWRQQLADSPATPPLPTDRPRPETPLVRGARRSVHLAPELTEALKALSRREGATLYMTLLAAFQTLLHRYSGQPDLLIGTPVAGRDRIEIEGLIGCFVNTLVMRGDLLGDPSFRTLLERVRRTALEAYAHQELPFEQLVAALQPERRGSRTPLVNVIFQLRNLPRSRTEPAALQMMPLEMDSGIARFDLSLDITEEETGLHCACEFSTDLFDRATIDRLLGHWRTLLHGIVADPDQRLALLPLLTRREHQQMLVEWNDTRSDYPRDRCIHHLIETQVARTPGAAAVSFGQQRVTYAELNDQADRLARRLQCLGVGPGVLVAVCLERSLEMVVGPLAVWKAGGAYVPIDPLHPQERNAAILADSGARVLLTQRALTHNLPAPAAHQLCLDDDEEWGELPGSERPVPTPTADDLAYVIYTSGSTGRPKGVEIPHRAVVNFLTSTRERPGLGPEDVWVAITTLSFDISVEELFLPLTVGAHLVVVSSQESLDARQFLRTLRDLDWTVLQATPATWRLMVELGWEGKPGAKLLCGGEALSRELADQLLARSASLWNLYGPTETTIYSSAHPVGAGTDAVPIGRPIANTSLYVLDPHGQPVPVGVPGELYIGGEGLARGYLNQPELTAERFLPDPFSPTPGARMYRTGDRARYRSDGNVEFLGRLDHQVKVRGFRIELGEIETVLRRHPQVDECLVLAREDRPGEISLVVYLVQAAGPPVPPTELRHFLKAKLPEYMLPAVFVTLKQWPLTPNGKLDRSALPAPDATPPAPETEYVAPRCPVEAELAIIWADVLGRERVGIHDGFFELGGHSLLATQVISRLFSDLQIELPLRCLFDAPTVAALAAMLTATIADEAIQGPPAGTVARPEDE